MWRPERPGNRLTEAQARELEALDRILSGAPAGEVGEEHAELAGLVTAVREDRPTVGSGFAAELDERVAAGFPRRGWESRPGGGGRRRRVETRHWLAGLGGLATLAVVVAVVAGQTSPGHQPGIRAPSGGERTATPAQSIAPQGGAPGAASTAAPAVRPGGGGAAAAATGTSASGGSFSSGIPAPGPVAPPSGGTGGARVVQRAASVSLLAPRGHVQDVADRAIAATDRLGGIVESSNVALDDQGGSQASLELRVPGMALDRALAALSGLAHVSSRSQSALDITDATGAARDRLAESRAERDSLLRALGKATTANQVASIHARLGVVDGRIAQDRARLATLESQGRTAHVSVTVNEDPQAAGGAGSAWGPGAALDDAAAVLETVFGVAAIALAVLVPVGILGGLGWWVSGPVRRRRREAVLAGTVL